VTRKTRQGHFIANYPHEKKDEDEGKKKKEKSYSKDKKASKKKYFGEAYIGQEWDSNEDNSDSDNEGVATIATRRPKVVAITISMEEDDSEMDLLFIFVREMIEGEMT
jgi:hypothetical protein